VIRVREGFLLRVDGDSQTGRIAYATGSYEPRTTAVMKALLHRGDTVIDVGANIGYFSIVAARAVGPTGRVVAFEPVPAVRQALIANLTLNHLDHVTIRHEALSQNCGSVVFHLGPTRDTGLGSLRALPGGHTLEVEQARFDDIWDRESRISLVKIDVEGAELLALQGMIACLKRDRPNLILEVTDEYLRGLGSSATALLEFLVSLSYNVFRLPESGPIQPIADGGDLSTCPTQFNVLCSVRPDMRQVLVNS